MIKAVIFDLDDTLISEREYVDSGFKHIAALLSCRIHAKEASLSQLMTELFNQDSNNVFNRLLDRLMIAYSQGDIIEIVEVYRSHMPVIQFFDDVLPFLDSLREKEIKLGIITDGYAKAQGQKLKAVKAQDYFDEIIVTDELGREYWKPHPKAFEMMKEKLNVEYDEMIYIGDNPAKDFYVKKYYPINTIRINRSGIYKNRDYLENIKEDLSIFSLSELADYRLLNDFSWEISDGDNLDIS